MKFRQHNARAARLEPDQVMAIRQSYAGGATQRELAIRFGVSVIQIGRIVRGEAWQRLPTVETDQEIELRATLERVGAPAQGAPPVLTPEEIAASAARVAALSGVPITVLAEPDQPKTD